MNAIVNIHGAAPSPAATALTELHHRAQVYLCFAAFGHAGNFYQPIAARVRAIEYRRATLAANRFATSADRAAVERDAAELASDLQQILDADVTAIKTMVTRNAVTIGGNDPGMDYAQREQARQATTAAVQRPAVDGGAIVAGLRRRGLSVVRSGDSVHVSPAGVLNDQDRRILREQRGVILTALADDGEVF